jgi:hypothetical protein
LIEPFIIAFILKHQDIKKDLGGGIRWIDIYKLWQHIKTVLLVLAVVFMYFQYKSLGV